MTPKVVDLYHGNIVTDLIAAKEAGILGVIHKATEGLTFVDSKLKARHFLTTEAGLAWGVYHFLRPGDPSAQASHFLATTTQLRGPQTLVAVDYEDAAVSLADLCTFMRIVEAMTGQRPVLYAGNVLKEALGGKPDAYLSSARLWLADYGTDYTLPAGFSRFWLRQYTDHGRLPGIIGDADLNEINQPDGDFLHSWLFAGKNAVSPTPTPQPAPESPSITLSVPKGTKVIVNEV